MMRLFPLVGLLTSSLIDNALVLKDKFWARSSPLLMTMLMNQELWYPSARAGDDSLTSTNSHELCDLATLLNDSIVIILAEAVPTRKPLALI
jgi:hypothetical protein